MCSGTRSASLFANDLFEHTGCFFLEELLFERFKQSFFLEVWVDYAAIGVNNFHYCVVYRS